MTEVIEKTEYKKGYKKTKLGWIPEDWEIVKSGKLFHNYSKKNNKQEELLSVTQDKGVIPRSMVEARIAMPEGSTSSYKLVEKGDFVISLRSFQGGIEYSEYRGVVSPAYTILKRNLAISDGYYKQWFKSSEFIARLGVAIIGIRDGKQISYEDFSMLPICYPPLKEQEKIAEILSAWDDGIETLERLIEQKEIFHKALMKNLLIGKIRLSEFSSKLTHSKFNSIFERITRKNEELNSNILTISAQNGLISQKDFYNKRIASVDTSKYILLKNGEFAYNKSYSNGYPLGAIKRLDLYEKGVVSNLYICFKLNNSDNCSDFWKYYFEAGMLNREIKMIAQEGARNHGLLNMATEDFFNMLLFYPKDLKEQQKIAEILNKSDKEIQILNFKLEKLKKQKKGLMQKLLTGQIRVKI